MSIDNNDITNEFSTLDKAALNERASDKAFAKLSILEIDLVCYQRELSQRDYGAITRQELMLLIDGTKKEILTWSYIMTLIEKDNVL